MKKIDTLRKASLASRILRALGKESGFELPLPSREKKALGISAYHAHYSFHKELSHAMVEAERSKARGITEHQRRNLPR